MKHNIYILLLIIEVVRLQKRNLKYIKIIHKVMPSSISCPIP
jgi:hypothetical protein